MARRISRNFVVGLMTVILLAPLTGTAHTETHMQKSSAAPAMVETDSKQGWSGGSRCSRDDLVKFH